MNSNNYKKEIKKAKDTLKHYKYIIKEIKNIKSDLTIFKSFLANSVILKLMTLKGNEYKEYLNEIKKEKIFDNLLNDTISRKIKNIILKINPKIYFRMR